MNNPIAVFHRLRDLYLRYLDSPLAIRYDSLRAERRALLDADRRMWREPVIEPTSVFPLSGGDFAAVAHSLLDAAWGSATVDEVGDFLGPTLFPGSRRPYLHQREAFERALVDRRDVVVTTGTGSGKTECFLVPVLAELIRESAQWTPPGARSPTWDWWDDRHRTMQGQNPRYAQRVPQRGHETRPAAIRALLLYPLNALVEDQLVRLRVALDSPAPRAWLDTHRHGNRIYFGRYTSRTPIPGGRQGAAARLRAEFRDLSREAEAVAGSRPRCFFRPSTWAARKCGHDGTCKTTRRICSLQITQCSISCDAKHEPVFSIRRAHGWLPTELMCFTCC